MIKREGGESSFKGYRNYPASICISINDEVVHGIPGNKKMKEGDIVSLDLGVKVDGFCGDAAITFPVGEISETAERLIEVTEDALYCGIGKAKIGNRLFDISHAIQTLVESAGLSVVRDFVGHGVGRNQHEDPQIPNYGLPNTGLRLQEGMTLAIEPMVNLGTWRVRVNEKDKWTVTTADGMLSAHFEHTIAITQNGPDILSLLPEDINEKKEKLLKYDLLSP